MDLLRQEAESALTRQKEADHQKFSQDFGRAAAREAELVEKNRQMQRDLENAGQLMTEKVQMEEEMAKSRLRMSTLAAAVESYEQALKELTAERDTLLDRSQASRGLHRKVREIAAMTQSHRSPHVLSRCRQRQQSPTYKHLLRPTLAKAPSR